MSILGHHIAIYHSYTFCPGYILELVHSMDPDNFTASNLLFEILKEIQDHSDSLKEIMEMILLFEPVFA